MEAVGRHIVEAHYPRKLLYSRELHGVGAGSYVAHSGQQSLRMPFEDGRVVLRVYFRRKTSYTVASCEPAYRIGSYLIGALGASCVLLRAQSIWLTPLNAKLFWDIGANNTMIALLSRSRQMPVSPHRRKGGFAKAVSRSFCLLFFHHQLQQSALYTTIHTHQDGTTQVLVGRVRTSAYTYILRRKRRSKRLDFRPCYPELSEQMSHCQLTSHKNSPPCNEALPYEWGSAEDPVVMYIGKSSLPVRRNLADALQHLRYRDMPRTL